jgi:hypothetical protein
MVCMSRRLFRQENFDILVGPIDQEGLESLRGLYLESFQNISEAATRIQEVAHLAFQRAHVTDFENFQKVMSLKDVDKETTSLPCNILPVARNKRFFGREELLKRIDTELACTPDEGIRSVALHGLGGVGKTQVALAYAYSKTKELDAIFWIAAETDVVLKQSFSRIAMQLKLPNAHPQNHEENTILVLSWLNQTSNVHR